MNNATITPNISVKAGVKQVIIANKLKVFFVFFYFDLVSS